jgi:D-ribose pyranase
MILYGLINPHIASLLCRIRHTNALVISDASFPFWPQIETVDIALTRGIPTIPQVLDVLLPIWRCGQIFMAEEFKAHNTVEHQQTFGRACRGAPIALEPHVEFKRRVPNAIGLIRTGDDTMYGNMILVSA